VITKKILYENRNNTGKRLQQQIGKMKISKRKD
jgi:hypothetical protein